MKFVHNNIETVRISSLHRLRLLGILLFFSLLVSTASTNVYAQRKSANKYSIQLPDEWNNKSKLLSKIIYIIDTHIPELDGKELCLACQSDYTVSFKLSNPVVQHVYYSPSGTTAYTALYRFFAYMDVSHVTGQIIHRLVLNDTSVVHSYRSYRSGSFTGATMNPGTMDDLRGAQPLNVPPPITLPRVDGAVADDRIKAAMAPEQKELWRTVERVIMKFKFSDEE